MAEYALVKSGTEKELIDLLGQREDALEKMAERSGKLLEITKGEETSV